MSSTKVELEMPYHTAAASFKRQKHHHCHNENSNLSLLPGLPDDVAQICLSLVHPSILYSVCHSWRRLIYSPSFPPFLSIYALCVSTKAVDQASYHSTSAEFSCFEPLSCKWLSLPPPPLQFLLHHPSFISRKIPIQSVNVSGNLVLLAATADQFLPALSRPLIFNPLSQRWTYGPPFAAPRRWCIAGASRGVVYVASGIGSRYNTELARSVEKWDLKNINNNGFRSPLGIEPSWKWEKMGELKDGKFSRESVDAIGWRGTLCMVNVKGDAAKEGKIYDVKTDAWSEMPEGMLVGWRGPAASMDEETIYVVDESKGALRKYDDGRDVWVEILVDDRLKGAQQTVAGGGKVCVLVGNGGGFVVVDVVAQPAKLWVVDTPAGFEAVSIHILPRMSHTVH
ncbi:F-box/kelch-repeat protein SKIP25-like [Olea europaea var. sylvestris]|uniref:F-box/kelch-repeat protein SKIP25-like n=1 Tax=Olea europaea var. sylvestris TaxID=158386 RepID=UPI000C1CFF07|nr:F-box/kelch-repeat protein SKIP25-like [Olea europaea var. sylvestris]